MGVKPQTQRDECDRGNDALERRRLLLPRPHRNEKECVHPSDPVIKCLDKKQGCLMNCE